MLRLRQVYAFSLRHVEHVGVTEAKQDALVLLSDVLLRNLVFLAANTNDGSKDGCVPVDR